MPRLRRLPTINIPKRKFVVSNLSGGLNSRDADHTIADNELSNGQNMSINPNGALAKRKGCAKYGNVLGDTTGILGLFEFVNSADTQVILAVYDTDIYYYNSGIWTSLSQTLTTNKPADGAYNPLTDKFYITNKTDDVVVITSTGSVTTDANFKKGKYIIYFQDRLITANLSGSENVVWYTDEGLDTFSANNYFTTEGAITGLELQKDKFLIFTKRNIFRVQNFTFDGVANSQPSSRIKLKTDVGAIYDRTIKTFNNLTYFLAQDHENKNKVMATDGWNVWVVSDKISPTLNGYAANQSSACAGIFGDKYFTALKNSGSSNNDKVLVYNTLRKRWLPEYTGWTPSCFMTAETSNQPTLYWGDEQNGRVYTAETGTFDELPSEEYHTGQDADEAITGATTVRAAQSFKLDKTETMTSLALYLKKVSGTTTELTVRIETDNAGKPSGTLADANATGTISAFSDTSYVWKTLDFSTAFSLTGSTSYWIVCQHTTEGSGTSAYAWGSDETSPTYTDGNAANYASSSWTADTNTDCYFMIFTKKDIDGYAETKAYNFGVSGQDKELYKGVVITDAPGSWNLEFGWKNNLYTEYLSNMFDMSSSTGATWGGGQTWGGGWKWGGSQQRKKHEIYYPSETTKGEFLKFRFRNQYNSETYTIYKLILYYYVSKVI